mmetsp:Transcript_34365/g.67609  ORF Transcript_34365/g.67609 Transcript_34365/m.67609 type:complete len:80 (-) Transcript_34365:174-413(-)
MSACDPDDFNIDEMGRNIFGQFSGSLDRATSAVPIIQADSWTPMHTAKTKDMTESKAKRSKVSRPTRDAAIRKGTACPS